MDGFAAGAGQRSLPGRLDYRGKSFILGAASNIIIIQNAERKTGHTLGLVEFARVGIPLTLVNVLACWIFLA